MLVAVDIGNTNIVLGFLDGDTIAGTYRITTKANHTSDEYGLFLTEFLRMSGFQPSDVDDVIICSVVPKVMHSFRSSIVKFLDIDPMVVGPGIKTGMNVRVDDPKSLGADILADCAGAYYEYGGPVLVADFGTATTFTHVSDKGVVDSGVITTGIRAGAAALWGDLHAGRFVLHVLGRCGAHDSSVPQRARRRGFQGDHHRWPRSSV